MMFVSIFLLIILIGVNGFFSLCELAFLSVDKLKLKKELLKGDKRAIEVDKILKRSSDFLSTIQIGITLAGFLASAFAADYFADYFIKVINISIISDSFLRGFLVIVITIILSYFTLVFGELIPKKVAMSDPIKYAYKYIYLIKIVNIIFKPLVILLTKSVEFMCKVLMIKDKDNKISEEDIRNAILVGKEEGVLEDNETNYIMNVFEFNDIPVGDIMTLKKDVVMLSLDNKLKDNILIIKENKYSRYPVMKDNQVVGIINVKDLVLSYSGDESINLEKMVKKTSKYYINDKIDDVFHQMRDRQESVGFIYDKTEFVGIVAVEDLIEEIVGNIYDEYDDKKNDVS